MKMNAEPCGSGSTAPMFRYRVMFNLVLLVELEPVGGGHLQPLGGEQAQVQVASLTILRVKAHVLRYLCHTHMYEYVINSWI